MWSGRVWMGRARECWAGFVKDGQDRNGLVGWLD